MRLIFAGTPEFARVALQDLCSAGHSIGLVLTQPDRPAGRGMRLQASSVKQFAQSKGMPLAQPRSLRLDGKFPEDARQAQTLIQAVGADAMIVAAYGLVLPKWVLQAPRLGCLNIHASLLPRWRGAAPIQRAIEAGDAETGISIMQMDEGLDTGPVWSVAKLPITEQDTTATLHDRLAELGARQIVQALDWVASAKLTPTAQPSDGVTYADKISKQGAALDWRCDAAQLARKIRAFTPMPGCTAALRGESLKVLSAHAIALQACERSSGIDLGEMLPGCVLDAGALGVDVWCGHQTLLRLTHLQRSGGKALAAADFLRGFALNAGERFQALES